MSLSQNSAEPFGPAQAVSWRVGLSAPGCVLGRWSSRCVSCSTGSKWPTGLSSQSPIAASFVLQFSRRTQWVSGGTSGGSQRFAARTLAIHHLGSGAEVRRTLRKCTHRGVRAGPSRFADCSTFVGWPCQSETTRFLVAALPSSTGRTLMQIPHAAGAGLGRHLSGWWSSKYRFGSFCRADRPWHRTGQNRSVWSSFWFLSCRAEWRIHHWPWRAYQQAKELLRCTSCKLVYFTETKRKRIS